jgi:O-antigen/teichoic acid export membrane protein
LVGRFHRRAAVGTVWNLLGTGIGRTGTLVGTVLLAHVLGATHFGGLVLVQTTALTVATVSGLGLSFATTRFVSQHLLVDRRQAGQFLTAGIGICIGSGAVFGICFAAASGAIGIHVLGHGSLVSALRLASPLLLFSPLADTLIAGVTGSQDYRRLGIAQALRGGLDAALLVAGSVFSGVLGGIAGLDVAEALTCLIVVGLVVRAQHRQLAPSFVRPDRTVVRRLMRFAIPSLSTALLFQGALWLGQVILAHHSGLAAVGVFVFAARFYLVLLFLPQVIGTVLFPMMAGMSAAQHREEFRTLFRNYVRVTMALAVSGGLVLFLGAKAILSLRGLATPRAIETLQLLAIAAVPTVLNSVLGQGAVALNRVRWWLFSDVALAIGLLGSAAVLIPSHGPVGLALAYLIGYGVTCVAIAPAFSGFRRQAPQPVLESGAEVRGRSNGSD